MSRWLVFALLMLGVLAVGWSSAGVVATGEEATLRLAAESLARDADLLFTAEDEERMLRSGWTRRARPELLLSADGRMRFAVPVFFPAVLAPFVGVSPIVGPLIANSTLLGLLWVIASRSLARRLGDGGGWTTTAAVFGTSLALYARTALPAVFVAVAAAAAVSLLALDEPVASRRLHEMYPAQPSRSRSVWRWLAAGVLLAAVITQHPVAWILLVLPAVLVPRRRLAAALSAMAFGLAITLLAAWLSGGIWPHLGAPAHDEERVRASVDGTRIEIERAALTQPREDGWRHSLESPLLAGWNAWYTVAGRHVGVVPYFPLLVWLVLSSPRRRRHRLLLSFAAVALLATLLWSPFDFTGLPAALGVRAFVPFFVVLWWMPERSLGAAGGLAWLAIGLAVLFPLWRAADGPLRQRAEGRLQPGPLLRYLPPETTQRRLSTGGEIHTRDLVVKALSGFEPGGRSGHLRLEGQRGELLVATAGSLESLALRFDSTAGAELEAPGWTASDTLYAPDGSVVFTLRPRRRWIRHPVWWSDEEHEFQILRLYLPSAFSATTMSMTSVLTPGVDSTERDR